MKTKRALVMSALCGMLASVCQAADPGKLSVDATTPGPKVGPLFYGLMTEEINHSYDGGLYAELIQNRIFQDAEKPVCWSVVKSGGGDGSIAIDQTHPVNDKALKRSLKLEIASVSNGERVGIANSGFWGIPVWPNTKYHASFYARTGDGFTGPLTVDIEKNDGSTVFATAAVTGVGADWKKYEVDLTTGDVPKSTGNQFVISGGNKGSVWVSLVSLFPPTYHNRPNGNRVDLMQKLADLHPSFLRFPGGNFLEGDTVATRFQWKQTIGPLEDRPGHMGCWNYHVSDGLGLLEFLEWCEDLKMEPLLAVYDGYSLKGEHVEPGKDLEPFIQEGLEEIEYCTGDASTTWGKRRIADGHPDPFVIHYIEIGNEDWFDKSKTYDGRFAQMFDAIKAKYPQLLCIATAPVTSRRPDLYDDHAYPHDRAMRRMTTRYDHPKAGRPKVFFGEWATEDGRPTPTLRGGLDDAAWLTGLQRDCDTVLMNCYAPLLVNVNKGAWQWPTNLIGYDAADSFGSPSYYAQAMFSRNWGDTVLQLTIQPQTRELPPDPALHGGVGVGTWHTAADYKNIKVTQAGQTLFESDFNGGLKGWKPTKGTWEANNGILTQSDPEPETTLVTGKGNWQDYTLELDARKTGGKEGFLVMFHAQDKNNFAWFNVGGWGNTKSGLQIEQDGGEMDAMGEDTPFTVENNKWYHIKVECKGLHVKAYIDGQLVTQGTEAPSKPTHPLFAVASRVDATGEVILKVVNVVAVAELLAIDLKGIASISKDATLEVLQGDPNAQNSVEEPTKIVPQRSQINDAGLQFTHEFPPYSVSVIRLKP